VNIITAGTTRK